MAHIKLDGHPIHTSGSLPAVGSVAPAFTLAKGDLKDIALSDFGHRKKVLSIFPTLDTGVCQAAARRFHALLAGREDVVLLYISADLPIAAHRFCSGENLSNVVTLSTFRSPAFGRDYGVVMVDGGMHGLLSRAVLVLDETNRVLHAEQVPDIAQEPNYDAVLNALS